MRTSNNHVLIRWRSKIQWMEFSEPTATGGFLRVLLLGDKFHERVFPGSKSQLSQRALVGGDHHFNFIGTEGAGSKSIGIWR